MKNSIETIWKEGFLNEKQLVAPQINDLYNRKSIHVVDRVKRMFRINFVLIIVLAIVLPVISYAVHALWQGLAVSALLLLTAWYNHRQLRGLSTLDQGATSLAYLRAFDQWLNDVLARSVKVARFSYPLYFLIALSIVWSAWNGPEGPGAKIREKFPELTVIGNVPIAALAIAGAVVLLMFWFSDRIYKWDVRLMYGRVFSRLKRTLAEMETLQHEA
ncbi:hypothetical protein GCM10007415_45330 [Parapedobacter pyrenivorans]|uniref:Uncharacterized protein n=1 Tax=Parapedobacter pyrenivorans TaxID=1305674 RepID=A0A917I2R1_9SPHI|nr:hypothetical protein [Parapedobacter pyrenivorans]GGH04057.1 hypothetical protein GCM10007415_45330 [Parapedobacter pyrenivorans]